MDQGITDDFHHRFVEFGFLALGDEADLLAGFARQIAHQRGKREKTVDTGTMRTFMMVSCRSSEMRAME